jgi:hypothetical protein
MEPVMKTVRLEVIISDTNTGITDIVKVAITDYSYCIFTVCQSVGSTHLVAAINKLI